MNKFAREDLEKRLVNNLWVKDEKNFVNIGGGRTVQKIVWRNASDYNDVMTDEAMQMLSYFVNKYKIIKPYKPKIFAGLYSR